MSDLTGRLDRARVGARRRRHESTEPEHLLAVILEEKDVSAALVARGVDPAELSERREARLAGRAAVGGYRDGVEAAVSPALRRVVKRVGTGARRWLPFASRATILDALLLEPAIASLVFELRRGNDYRYVVERARALAVMSGHTAIGVAHVFRVLLDLRSFVDTLERAGGDAAPLRALVETTLGAPRDADAVATPVVEPVLERMMRAETMTIRQLCLALADLEEATLFWCTAGIEPSDFIRAVHLP